MSYVSMETDIILLINLVKRSVNSNNSIAEVVNYTSWQTFSVMVSIFLLHMMYVQIHSKIMLIFIHSSLCVLNFLPACIPTFAGAACITQMVQQTAVSILLIYCTAVCKYCQSTQAP